MTRKTALVLTLLPLLLAGGVTGCTRRQERAAERIWRDNGGGRFHRVGLNNASKAEIARLPGLSDEDRALVADPQTSGGLLIAVPADRLDRLLAALKARGVTTRAVIGEVIARTDASLDVY